MSACAQVEASVALALAAARAASGSWRETPLRRRLDVLRRCRRLIARDPLALAEAVGEAVGARRDAAETLVSEVLPLAEAIRFLEREATRLLAPRRLRRGRPLWLWGVASEVRREPYGVVLVLAPSNYPLFLPGAQIVQALAAGNAVCVKPAPGCAAPVTSLAALLRASGLPEDVLRILADSPETGAAASAAGFERIVLTGSAETGAAVLAAAAPRLTPCTMELSGSDAVFVLPGAALELVADCVAYGLRLNAGATCIAPRRIFATLPDAAALETLLRARVVEMPAVYVPPQVAARLDPLLAEAAAAGARVERAASAVLVFDASPDAALLASDVFAPVVSVVPVADMTEALLAAGRSPYALGASIFGPSAEASRFAGRVDAGSVVVNDVIVPTADPRLPFGGRRRSGFGVTRGTEGLLEMTIIKSVSIRRGRFRPHLASSVPDDTGRFTAMVAVLHGSWRTRWRAIGDLTRPRRKSNVAAEPTGTASTRTASRPSPAHRP